MLNNNIKRILKRTFPLADIHVSQKQKSTDETNIEFDSETVELDFRVSLLKKKKSVKLKL